MDFPHKLGIIAVSLCLSIPGWGIQVASTLKPNAVTVTSSWANNNNLSFKRFEEALAEAMHKHSLFRRSDIVGKMSPQEIAILNGASGQVSADQDMRIFYSLKPTYPNFPEMLITLKRSESPQKKMPGGAMQDSFQYVLVDPVQVYFSYRDAGTRMFRVSDIHLNFTVKQAQGKVFLSSAFEVRSPAFVDWVSDFLGSVQIQSATEEQKETVTMQNVLQAVRLGFLGIHQYLSKQL